MVNDLLTAVTTQLGTTFGTDYHYYVEDVKQDLRKPCFTVDMIQPMQRSRNAIVYDRIMPLVVHYFSDKPDEEKEDCYEMAEKTVECLEYLPFKGELLCAENVSWHIVEGVLQIFITYKFKTKRVVEPTPDMEILEETDTLTN